MKNFSLPTTKELLVLGKIKPLEDKIKAINNYLKIETIYCDIANLENYHYPEPDNDLLVTKIGIPGGTPSYIKPLLNEWLDIMTDEIESYLRGDDDFETIAEQLERCLELCKQSTEKNDTNNRLKFEYHIRFEILNENQSLPVRFQYLKFDPEPLIDYQEHFDLRKIFFLQLVEEFKKALDFHLQKTDLTKNPYTWDSERAELEASELVYLLCKKAEMIKFDKAEGGSFAKFKKDFFGLFGLSDKRYEANVSDILIRKKGQHFIDKLKSFLSTNTPELPNE